MSLLLDMLDFFFPEKSKLWGRSKFVGSWSSETTM